MGGKLKVAVLGASGYAGEELVRILTRHPRVQTPIVLERQKGKFESDPVNVADLGHASSSFSWESAVSAGVEVLFLATPHDVSRTLVPEALDRGLRVVDLSGAWRLKCTANRAVYNFADEGSSHAAEVNARAVYGLPELNRELISNTELVANPGCYATSIILALAPLITAGVVDRKRGIISDSKSGVSGAGKEPTSKTHFVSVADNFSAYSIFGHRHTGEILEQLDLESAELIFTPHLLPIPRGILSTIYVHLNKPMAASEVEASFRRFYSGSPCVRVFSPPQLPQIHSCLRTNFCDIGFCIADDHRRLVLISCVDNLLKGAAGQAVQNMNLMYGWKEEEGLT